MKRGRNRGRETVAEGGLGDSDMCQIVPPVAASSPCLFFPLTCASNSKSIFSLRKVSLKVKGSWGHRAGTMILWMPIQIYNIQKVTCPTLFYPL